MDAGLKNSLREFMNSLHELAEAKRNYKRAIATAKDKSEEVSTLLNHILQQPHIEIIESELDG